MGCGLPEIIRSIIKTLTDPIIHELIHLIDSCDGSSFGVGTRFERSTIVASSAWPANFRYNLRLVRALGEDGVMRFPEGPCPSSSIAHRDTTEKGMHVRHDSVGGSCKLSCPLVPEVRCCDRHVGIQCCEIRLDALQVLDQGVFGGIRSGTATEKD